MSDGGRWALWAMMDYRAQSARREAAELENENLRLRRDGGFQRHGTEPIRVEAGGAEGVHAKVSRERRLAAGTASVVDVAAGWVWLVATFAIFVLLAGGRTVIFWPGAAVAALIGLVAARFGWRINWWLGLTLSWALIQGIGSLLLRR
jgi:hypothetical protein